MTAAVVTAPTEADLRAAWQICRRATWPATFEDAMADPLLSRVVVLTAKHPAPAAGTADAYARSPAYPDRKTPPTGRTPYLPGMPPGVDRKRAAAGERDDD